MITVGRVQLKCSDWDLHSYPFLALFSVNYLISRTFVKKVNLKLKRINIGPFKYAMC